MPSRSIAAVVLLVAAVACDKVPLGAPTGASITVTAPTRALAVGGSTEISAFVSESSGTPVQNGTAVRFTTTLGTVDPVEAQTFNGVAVTTLQAGTVSGVAQVRATSGAGTGGSGGTATNLVEIAIGAATVATISLSSSSATVPSNGGTVTLTATVADASGNRVRGVVVTFTTTAGSLSASAPTTDGNGETSVQFTTNRTATVTARVGAGDAARTGAVTITAAAANSIALTVAPNPATAGSPVTLTVTPTIGTNNSAPRVVVNWGDGSSEDLGLVGAPRTAPHTYANPGTFTIVATATGDGETTTASTAVVITPRQPLSVTMTATPGPSILGVGNNTTFTATVTPAVGGADMVQTYTWNFGDGTPVVETSGSTTSHVYRASGAYTATVTVRTTDGRTATARTEFIVPAPI